MLLFKEKLVGDRSFKDYYVQTDYKQGISYYIT
jgi:hypothetical protein